MDTDWREWGLCILQGTPTSVFYPRGNETGEVEKAKRICFECDVREKCLDYAIYHQEIYGIWGGMTETERYELNTRRVLQGLHQESLLRNTRHEQVRLASESLFSQFDISCLTIHTQQVSQQVLVIQESYSFVSLEVEEPQLLESLPSGPNQKILDEPSLDESESSQQQECQLVQEGERNRKLLSLSIPPLRLVK